MPEEEAKKKHYLPKLDILLEKIEDMERRQKELRLQMVKVRLYIFDRVAKELGDLDVTDPLRFEIFWKYVNADTVLYKDIETDGLLRDISGFKCLTEFRDHWRSTGGLTVKHAPRQRWSRRHDTAGSGE